MKIICIHAIVHGKVQGVFYRDSTCKHATSMHITGWVKNNDNGTVELHARGPEEKIKSLVEWLWQGPPRAKVTDVEWHEIPDEMHDQFIIC